MAGLAAVMVQLRETMLKQVGNYILTEKIGRGALSRVYRAVDQQGRPVAIKVSTTQAEPEQLESLQRDLVAAASVLHPNVVGIHDLGFEDDYPYLVMDLVVGRDFGKILKSNAPSPVSERMGVMGQIGEALRAAHERQVFHLDVRPSKIMLSNGGIAKLLGLGLGRLSYDPGRDSAQGYLIGSPFYMSPERLAALDIANAQCDIWSFAVTLYEFISGKHPFHDEDGDRMIGNIIVDQPAPLAGVPATLNRVMLRALAKEPADRYLNFAELLAEFKPTISEVQRAENEALLAQALEATANGPCQEARRAGRRAHEPDAVEEAALPAFAAAESAAQSTEKVNETPLAAPATGPMPSAVPPAAPKLERTTPKPPINGERAGAPRGEGPSAAATRPSQKPWATAGVPAATAAVLATNPTTTLPAVRRRRRQSAPARSAAALTPAPAPAAVRVIEFTESRGMPWGKMMGVAAVGLLAAGLSFYFLRQPNRLVKAVDASYDAKTLRPASRVIKPNRPEQPIVPAFAQTVVDQATTTILPPALNDVIDETARPPRPFDPKSLGWRQGSVRRPVSRLAALAPPAVGSNLLLAEAVAAPPIALNAPPPPPTLRTAARAAATTAVQPARTPGQPAEIRHGGSFKEPFLVYSVRPIYPFSAIQKKAQGVVHFQATVAKDGSLKGLQLISGDPLLNNAAKEAVSQWRYRPATLNGEPVEVTQDIIVKFSLDR